MPFSKKNAKSMSENAVNSKEEKRKKKSQQSNLFGPNRDLNSNANSKSNEPLRKFLGQSGPRSHKKIENKLQDVTPTEKTERDLENSKNLYSNERTKTKKRKMCSNRRVEDNKTY